MKNNDEDLQAVIFVSGRDTPAENCPAPFTQIAGRPFLDHLITNIVRHGFTDILLLADQLDDHTGALEGRAVSIGCRITCIAVPSATSTASTLLQIRERLADRFLLLDGEKLFDINYLDLCGSPYGDHKAGVIALRQMADTAGHARAQLAGGNVESFAEAASRSPSLAHGGVSWLERSALDRIAAEPVPPHAPLLPYLAKAGLFAGKSYDGFFIDMAVPEDPARRQAGVLEHMRRPAIFLSRDGVLNADTGYPHRPHQIEWTEGAHEAVKLFNDHGYFVFVVTNQSGIAHGLYEEETVRPLHRWMNAKLRKSGAHIDDWRYCPYHPDAAVGAYRAPHPWRKPCAGMLLDLMKCWPVDCAKSFLIGERETDLKAAHYAGIPGYLFRGGSLADFASSRLSTPVVDSLAKAEHLKLAESSAA